MRKFGLFVMFLLINSTLSAEVKNEASSIDKLDALDKQSQDFFKAITGLEKDYLQEQVNQIKSNKEQTNIPNNQMLPNSNTQNGTQQEVITPEEYEKNVFKHQNELARLTTDFTRTKELKDIKIKSMYSFNGKSYVVLKLEKTNDTASTKKEGDELSSNIEGRYVEGDYILGHKITKVDVRTKSVELYKKLDENNGYSIYLSNYGISVSELLKKDKKDEEKTNEPKKVEEKNEKTKIKDVFNNVKEEKTNDTVIKKSVDDCLYTVKVSNLNVRNSADSNATILRILRVNDQFTVDKKVGDWVKINTIYKKISGDVMPVENENNWLLIADDNVNTSNKSCL